MNKIEFISKLDYSLKGISYEDKKEIIYDYEEHFAIGIEQGKTEEDIAKTLGDPKIIAKQFRNDYFIKKAEHNKSAGNLVSAIFASVGVGFLNLFMLPIIIAAF
ncbi:MAG: HAAS signaling domain-containing protein [Ruminiclostridium sp.]